MHSVIPAQELTPVPAPVTEPEYSVLSEFEEVVCSIESGADDKHLPRRKEWDPNEHPAEISAPAFCGTGPKRHQMCL